MNVVLHEWRLYRLRAAVWALAIFGIAAVFLSFFPAITADLGAFRELISNFPPPMQALFGESVDRLSEPLGYYLFALTYVFLGAAYFGVDLGLIAVAREGINKTSDFLFTKPRRRGGIFAAKVAAGLSLIAGVWAVSGALNWGALALLGDVPAGLFWKIQLCVLGLMLTMFAIGIGVGSLLRRVKTVLPISLGVTFVLFALSAFAVQSADDKLRYLTPFQYFRPEQVMEAGFEPQFLMAAAAVAAVSVAAGAVHYCRRDIHAV